MRTRVAILIMLSAVLLAAAACGGRNETTTVTVTTTVSETTAVPAGPAVAELQQVMTTLGYYSGPINGVYDDATTEAVKAMQVDLGVTPDGIYGSETDAALKGKGNGVVAAIQTTLTTYGYYDGPINGAYDSTTQDAVKQLQTDLGVTPDGRIGPETVAAFNDAVESGKLKPSS